MIDIDRILSFGSSVVLQCKTDHAFDEIRKLIGEYSPSDVAYGRISMISSRRAMFGSDFHVRLTFDHSFKAIVNVGGHRLSYYRGTDYPILCEDDYLMRCNPVSDDFDESICVSALFGSEVAR